MSENCRRQFLKRIIAGSAFLASGGYFLLRTDKKLPDATLNNPESESMHMIQNRTGSEAMFYQQVSNGRVQCLLCPHSCTLDNGSTGLCRVRKNFDGKLHTLVYGYPCTYDIGPIEKAPLYHFVPAHNRLCIATVGCNLRCRYCHNWHISQRSPGQVREYEISAEEMVEEAPRRGVNSISFTYTEPTVFYEYMLGISRLAKEKNIKTSIVSNGYINPEPMRKLLPHLDAVKIDLKSFSEDFYENITSASLEPVKRTLRIVREEGVFLEIVNLVVPGLNDDPGEIRSMCNWIKDNLGDEVPVHFSRFSPTYRLTELSPTPVSTLETAVRIAYETGLKYVYIGNVPGHKHNSTFCPDCKEKLIERAHFTILANNIEKGKCRFCGYAIAGIWEIG